MATVFKGFKYCNELAGARGGDIGEMWCMYDGGNIGINKLSVKRGDFVSWGANGWKLEPNMKFLTSLDSFDMTQLAPEFDDTKTYQPGDVVVYNNELYVCVNAHTGDWDADDFAPTDMTTAMAAIGDEIKILEVTWDSNTNSYVFPAVTDVVEAVDNYESVVLRYTSPTGVRRFYLLNEFKRNTVYRFINVDKHTVFKIELVDGNLVWNNADLYDSALDSTSKNAPQTMAVDAEFGKIGGSIAPAYASLTFPIAEGTLCMYARRLYTCTASGGIPASEDWDPTHWAQTKVSEIIGNVEALLAAL